MTHEMPARGVYIHIPFCRTRCPYCDFVSNAIPGAVPSEFISALCEEIHNYAGPTAISSIFFGGGTPSLLNLADLEKIFQALLSVFNVSSSEITLEANPDDVSAELARGWRAIGFNRVSLGVQSFDDATLQYLGRRHDASKAFRAVETVAAEFENWNIDLIFGAFPVEAWSSSLETALQMQPPHIAAYSLTYEPSTPFRQRMGEAPEDDQMLSLFQQTESLLSTYEHYEISNYARPGFQCRHNLLYWHNEEYIGFGPGAYSCLAGKRIRNSSLLNEYLAESAFKPQIEMLSRREEQIETLIQHFRLCEGISRKYYQKRFGEMIDEAFADPLEDLLKRGLLQQTQERIFPTAQGFYLNNEIGLALVDVPGEGVARNPD